MSASKRLEKLEKNMLELRKTVRFHENIPADSPAKAANLREIVERANRALQSVTAEYNELRISEDRREQAQHSRYGG